MMKLQRTGKRLAIALGLLAPWTSLSSAVGQAPEPQAADVIHLPNYVPGRAGPVWVIGGIESAPRLQVIDSGQSAHGSPAGTPVAIFVQQGPSAVSTAQGATQKRGAVNAQPQEVKVVVQVEERNTKEARPVNDQALLQRRVAPPPRVSDPGETAGPYSRAQETRGGALGPVGGDDARPDSRRGAPQVRPDVQGQDRQANPPRAVAPQLRMPPVMHFAPPQSPHAPDFQTQPGTSFSPFHQSPWSQQVESLDRVLDSDVVRRILELKEENLELKASMKILEVQLGARQEIAELQTKMLREEAERAQESARRMQGEMELRARELHARTEEVEIQSRRSAEQFERARQNPREQAAARDAMPAEVKEILQAERHRLAQTLAELEESKSQLKKYEVNFAELKQIFAKDREAAEKHKQELATSQAGRAELDHRIRTLEAKLEEAESKLNASKRESAKQTEGAKKEAATRKKDEEKQESKSTSLKKDSDKKDSDKKDSEKKDSDKKDSE